MTVPFDLTDPAFHRDPYPVYRALRAAGPAVPTPYGSWVVTRFAEVSALLRDPRLGADFPADPRWAARHGGPGSRAVRDGRHWMLLTEGAGHRALRRAFAPHLAPRTVADRAHRVTAQAATAVDRLDPATPVDLVADLAEPVVAASVCDLLGLPGTDGARCAAWAADISRMTDPVAGPDVRDRVETALTEFGAHIETLAAQGRVHGVSAALLRGAAHDGLSTEAVLANLVMLAMAATDTTVSQITLAVLALLRHPDQLAAATADPDLARRSVAEFTRYDGPVHIVTRRATEPLELGGATVEAGAKVMLCLAAAGRDPGRCPDPDRLDLRRQNVPTLPFGDGPHYCLGSHLGRLVTGHTLSALLRRFPSLAPARSLDSLDWRPSVVARRPETLPVLLAGGPGPRTSSTR
ncbi:cytochrome P450 [Streptomyces niveiscabiei]|uniref:Cytochrome P450 n=1 Tax=Streptomyces niveiscabiei TaxID=164115 RepID=A0ABW9HKW5_9ACTN